MEYFVNLATTMAHERVADAHASVERSRLTARSTTQVPSCVRTNRRTLWLPRGGCVAMAAPAFGG